MAIESRRNFVQASRSRWIAASSVLLFALAPLSGKAEIIWSGDFDTGNFAQYHMSGDPDWVTFHEIPAYGRPIQYGLQGSLHVGDGSLLSLVQDVTREGPFAAKFTVKNAANGSEPADCDNGRCEQRRTQITMHKTLPNDYNALPYLSERWISISVYLPSDWEETRSGWGPVIMGMKPLNEQGLSGVFGLSVTGSSWQIEHRWSPVVNPEDADVPWQYQMFYTNDYTAEGGGPYPRSSFWADGLRDYPDVAASQAALGSLNTGGWTDWILKIKFDARGKSSGGTGFLTLWKREGSGAWVKVLHILPKQTSRGGMTFDHGIGYNSPPGSNNGGFGLKTGLYMDKSQVWGNARNRTVIIDNIKVGDQNTSFSEMSPDGSSPGESAPPDEKQPAPPNPPTLE